MINGNNLRFQYKVSTQKHRHFKSGGSYRIDKCKIDTLFLKQKSVDRSRENNVVKVFDSLVFIVEIYIVSHETKKSTLL